MVRVLPQGRGQRSSWRHDGQSCRRRPIYDQTPSCRKHANRPLNSPQPGRQPPNPMPRRPGRCARGDRMDSLTPQACLCHRRAPGARQAPRADGRHPGAPAQPPWAQVAISTTGVIRLTVPMAPTSCPRARCGFRPAWKHAVTMVEDADLRTLYFTSRRGAAARPWRATGGRPGASARAGGVRPAARPGAQMPAEPTARRCRRGPAP